MWLAVGALAIVGAIRVFLEIVFKAAIGWSVPTVWLVTQLAASVAIGALIGVHAPPRRRLIALLVPLLGIGLMFGLVWLDDRRTLSGSLTARYLPALALCPLAGLAAAEAVRRLLPAARSGPATTTILAGTMLVGMILVLGIGSDELLRLPGWMIFGLVLASAFVTGYAVQTLLATRQVNGCAAAPVFILLHTLGGDGVATIGTLLGSLVLAFLALWGAHRAWKRKPANPASPLPLARATAR